MQRPAALGRIPASGADNAADTPVPAQGVLVVNLGTPDAPTGAAVRRYLGEFLSDRRVVQVPRLLWWPLLHGVILSLRAPRVAKKYALVWMGEGSPLAVHTRRLAAAIGERLPGVPVARSEERRVGKECVSTCRSRWGPYH